MHHATPRKSYVRDVARIYDYSIHEPLGNDREHAPFEAITMNRWEMMFGTQPISRLPQAPEQGMLLRSRVPHARRAIVCRRSGTHPMNANFELSYFRV